MPFELKVIEKGHCPRCNGIAEYRIKKGDNDAFIPVYIVCPICKLDRYSYTTTRKEIKHKRALQKLYKMLENNPKKEKVILERIKLLERRML